MGMKELEEKFEQLVFDNVYHPEGNGNWNQVGEKISFECQKIAIEFAKYFKEYVFLEDLIDSGLYAKDYSGILPTFTEIELFQEFLKGYDKR
jgi:hypothetical protein